MDLRAQVAGSQAFAGFFTTGRDRLPADRNRIALPVPFDGIPLCLAKRLQVGRALPGAFHVADRDIKLPAQAPMKVADGHRRRPPDASRAVEVDHATGPQQTGQVTDAVRELLPHLGLFLFYRKAQEIDARGPIVGRKRRPVELHRPHVVVGLQIQHGGDCGVPQKPLDVIDGLGMRSDEESGDDRGVVHTF